MKSLAIVCLLLCGSALAFRKQGVAVKGTLVCNGVPEVGTKVKTWDVDRNPGDSDDQLAAAVTDRKGYFELDGTTRETTQIEPELRVYTDCNDGPAPCRRVLTFPVPPEYIHTGKAEKIYDFGRIELKDKQEKERRTCKEDQ
ncbi:unnamed protein product [Bursaphelenchus xylophilus]|uniref:(pine wood nematode) hypothetical protein n=1 Tax=Bursaphelenchus xylophilus TaxID=6326 RepID=A0A1I7SUR4_BURXY|nr:unnamed protein product [Bursaphelenchus xylophilus]CAG9125925.1 unnamed protein product [Bursaphelenchus xylophilus]